MASDDEEQTTEEQAAEGEAKGGKKKLILLIVIGLLLIGASVGGTITVLKMMQPEPVPAEGEMAEDEVEPPPKPAIYYPLKPEYILNIDARGRRRFLRLDLTVMIRDEDVVAAIELHRPTVDHTINLIAGGQIFEEVQTAEGKELLRLQLLQELQTLFNKEIGKPGIEQVLFTNFVMQ